MSDNPKLGDILHTFLNVNTINNDYCWTKIIKQVVYVLFVINFVYTGFSAGGYAPTICCLCPIITIIYVLLLQETKICLIPNDISTSNLDVNNIELGDNIRLWRFVFLILQYLPLIIWFLIMLCFSWMFFSAMGAVNSNTTKSFVTNFQNIKKKKESKE